MKAIIVEDEQHATDNLVLKIKRNCPGVDIVAMCSTGEEAILAISAQQPQLVFLDIHLRSMTGFDVLDRLQHIDFEVIFTTSYDNYAIRAIKTSALDYLLKPIDERELAEAVAKAWRAMQQKKKDSTQIALPIDNGLRIVECNEIVWCEANDNTSTVYLQKNNETLHVARALNEVYHKLPREQFFRIHRSYVVNRAHVAEVTREGFVALHNKKKLSISRDHKKAFVDWLSGE